MNALETLIGRNTGDLGWAQNFQNFGGQKDKYDKYFKDGQLKQGYSTSGAIGGSKKVFENKIRGEMVGTKDARYRKPGSTFQIYKLPGQQAAPAPAAAAKASAPAPLMPTISDASKKYRAETDKLLKEAQEAREQFKADQEAAVKAKAIAAANQARQGQTANLQIQPASFTPTTAGTQPFKRRKDQFKINTPAYSGLSISQSGMVNV